MILFYENISINNNNDNSIDNNVCSSNCPLNKVAVLIASSSFDYPLLSYTLRSLNLFMPCRHSVHIIVDNEASMKKLVAWIDINDVTIHEWKIPESIKIKMPGGNYIIQQYVGFLFLNKLAWEIVFAEISSHRSLFILILQVLTT